MSLAMFDGMAPQNEPDKQIGLELNGETALSVALTEKYRPRTLDDFIGLDKPRKVLRAFCAKPRCGAWFFVGKSGVGKSAMAFAVADLLDAEVHHIPSQQANIEELNRVASQCNRAPFRFFGPKAGPAKWHVIIVEEGDNCSNAFQLACLSRLDGTAPLPNTIWIFTANGTEKLEPRFLSRVWLMEFSAYGLRAGLAALLAKVWEAETGSPAPASINFDRIAKESNTNVRDALQVLEVELLAA